MRDTQSAPAELELVRGFVNTRDIEEGTDELADPGAAGAWLRGHGLIDTADGLGARELRQLVAVRELLRELLLANNTGEPVPGEVLDELNDRAERIPLHLRFDPEASRLEPAAGGAGGALAQLLAIVHAAIGDGSWGRLKVCPAPDCRWAFYDRSRNRSATWCQMGECGNRNKARAFRARRRGSA